MTAQHKIFAFILTAFLISLVTACTHEIMLHPFYKYNNVENRISELKEINPVIPSGSSFSFVVLSDSHEGHTEATDESKERFKAWLRNQSVSERPAFLVCLGDVADHAWEDEFASWKKFTDDIEAEFGIETYGLAGNHDLYKESWDLWISSNKPGTSFWTIKTPGFSLYALDTATGTLGTKQFSLLKEAMESDSNPKVVFSHYPISIREEPNFIFGMQDGMERDMILNLLQKNHTKLLLSGHIHKEQVRHLNSLSEYNLASFQFNHKIYKITVDGTQETASVEGIYLQKL